MKSGVVIDFLLVFIFFINNIFCGRNANDKNKNNEKNVEKIGKNEDKNKKDNKVILKNTDKLGENGNNNEKSNNNIDKMVKKDEVVKLEKKKKDNATIEQMEVNSDENVKKKNEKNTKDDIYDSDFDGDFNDENFDFDDIDDKYDIFSTKRANNLLDIIPITFSYYKEMLNFNLYCVPKNEEPSFYKKQVFTLFNSSGSYDLLWKLTYLHNKIWDSILNKYPDNKFSKYVKNHFQVSVGLFYENNVHYNYYDYEISDNSNNKIKKDITTYIGVKIMRLGGAFKIKWLKDEMGFLNSSLMLSFGWQSNIYFHKCCFHSEDTWVFSSTDYAGFDDKGYTSGYFRNNLDIKSIYFMIHLDFGVYFGKIYVRFYSPIGKQYKIRQKLYDDDSGKFSRKDSKGIQVDDNKNLLLNKWTMAIGFSLSL